MAYNFMGSVARNIGNFLGKKKKNFNGLVKIRGGVTDQEGQRERQRTK